MKVIITILIAIVLTCCIAVSYQYSKNSLVAIKELENERYSRMNIEESLNQANQRVETLETELIKLDKKLQSTQRILNHTKMSNVDLNKRLERAENVRTLLNKKIEELKKLSVL